MANEHSWPGPGVKRQAPPGSLVKLAEEEQGDGLDLNSIVSQAQSFVRSLAALVNDANKMRVESVSLRHENEGLATDNQRLQKEVDVLEGKLAFLEERIAKLEHGSIETFPRPAEDVTSEIPLPPDHDKVKRDFLALLSLTPRDWYMGGHFPVRDELIIEDNRKSIIKLYPIDAVYFMATGKVPARFTVGGRTEEERYHYKKLGLEGISLTEDDLPAVKKACGIKE